MREETREEIRVDCWEEIREEVRAEIWEEIREEIRGGIRGLVVWESVMPL